ncbi:MAG: winged helix-turn-helix domain-containing protein [Bellilinea sp.]|jgi:hypothetical protein
MFKNRSDYTLALLQLIDGLPNRQGQARDIRALFLERYRDAIPPTGYELLTNGVPRWDKEIQWCRYTCVQAGLMDFPTTGIWRLTEKGHLWLAKNPDATHLSIQMSKSNPKKGNASPVPVRKAVAIQPGSESGFLVTLQEYLPDCLQPIVASVFYEFVQRSNYLQIRLTGFSGCHYEFILRRGKHEIALHFESSAERSQARLRGFEPHIEALSQKLGMPVHAGDFGSRGWTQVYIETRPKPLTETLVEEYTALVERFVAATFPILKTVYAGERTAHTAGSHVEKFAPNHPIYAILDQEVANIRLYLEGRSLLPISDEKLCDWINFCYIFGMYSEGRELFSLVNGVEINAWYFERTKRIAKACEQKMHLFDLRNT